MNLDVLKRYMQQLISAKLLWKAQIMVTLAAFSSREEALQTKKNLPDSLIPDSMFAQVVAMITRKDDDRVAIDF